jgi:hypothetical protein
MKRLIYQVNVAKSSNLYIHCISSVSTYCERHNIDHFVQTQPVLRIRPDIFLSNRSRESYEKYGGFLPIYEKENAFRELQKYDQVAVVDADIYIRPDAPNVFDEFKSEYAFGAVCEREMPITEQYTQKIMNYSRMQYELLHMKKQKIDFKPNKFGYEFYNMGMMLMNSESFLPYLKNESPAEFIRRDEFAQFVDGIGNWKWSTDQTLLNYFIKKYKIPTQHMHWKWNGLFTANTKINECHFVHFFLKDKLPAQGENVEQLMEQIQ